ncbi:MAG TPA: hypothetical protein PKD32_05430 [Saprospiraceae bacterium]|nr:hypothetical protein [Saprospiraceae bacterium]
MLVHYSKLIILPDEVKAQNGIKVGAIVPRYDCIAVAGNYKGLEAFTNQKGVMSFYLTPSREVIETNNKRYAEYCLTGGKSLNFGSLYKFIDYPNFAYSYPNKKPFVGQKREPNPLYPFGNDLYLILTDKEYTYFEILVIEQGRNLAEHYLQLLIEGNFDTEIQKMRVEAKPIFEYVGLNAYSKL